MRDCGPSWTVERESEPSDRMATEAKLYLSCGRGGRAEEGLVRLNAHPPLHHGLLLGGGLLQHGIETGLPASAK